MPVFPGAMASAGAGVGATTAASGFPWLYVIPILLSLVSSLGEKSEEEKAMDKVYQLKNIMRVLGIEAPYQSRYLKSLDPMIAMALGNQLKRTSNWGWPAGMGIDTSFIDEFLKGITTSGVRRGSNQTLGLPQSSLSLGSLFGG